MKTPAAPLPGRTGAKVDYQNIDTAQHSADAFAPSNRSLIVPPLPLGPGSRARLAELARLRRHLRLVSP